MIDLNSKDVLSNSINSQIDNALILENKKQAKRSYLGGSRIGVDCERALQYEYFNVEKDADKEFSGRTLRIFERGFWVEDMVAKWLRNAGFELKTQKKNGDQFGWEAINGKFKGHCDGILMSGTDNFQYPALWENKGTGSKSYKMVVKQGLKKAKPEYYAQVQTYQHFLQLTNNPAFFSIVNMDTMEIHWELIEHNHEHTEILINKAIRILQACKAGELLPKQFHDPDFFKCKWCDWRTRCHDILPF